MQFEKKAAIRIDQDPFQPEANYVEPSEVLTAGIEEAPKEVINDVVEQFEKEEREIYPKAGESFVEKTRG